MKRIMSAVILAALPGSVLAQDASASRPMVLTVRPSGRDEVKSEAQARQERLLRRMEQSNHMVRSICTHCGDEWKHQIYAPFNPLASLNGSARPADEAQE